VQVKSFSEQLQQRQVYKVATIYAVSAWPLVQIADLSVPALGLPDSFMTLLLAIFILGFPVSLVFAWLFNFTDHGIVWASTDLNQTSSPKTNIQTTIAIVSSLLIVFVITASTQLYLEPEQTAPTLAPIESSAPKINSVKKESIAILPFVPFSNDPEDEFFADGMVEELLNLLAKIPKLQVTARTSSFAYKGVSNKTITEIGKELGVDTILEGSIRKSDITNQVRVTAQLIKVDTGEHLWSETYDREYTNIFQIQDDIATAVVNKMTTTLLGTTTNNTFSAETTNIDAMIANGKGQTELSHRSALSIQKALKHFSHAANLDNSYARAFVGIADANILLTLYSDIDKTSALQNAQNAINTALSLNPNFAAAYASQGLLHSTTEHPDAEKAFQKAIELNENYAMAYMWYGSLLKWQGKREIAHQYFEKALQLDPKSSVAGYNVAYGYYEKGDENKAMALFSHIIANDPYYPGAYNLAGKIFFERGRLDESIEMYQRGLEIESTNNEALKGLLVSLIDIGDEQATATWLEYAVKLIENLEFKHKKLSYEQYLQSEKHFYQKDYQQAISMLQYLKQQKVKKGKSGKAIYDIEHAQGVAHLAYAYKMNDQLQLAHETIKEFEQYLLQQAASKSNDPYYFYNMALLKALQGKNSEAFFYLQGAIDVGWVTVWRAEIEPIFTPLREDPHFSLMMGGVKARLATMRSKMDTEDGFSLAD